MNVTAWTGYAGMRAEVTAVSPGTSALTWYGTGVAAIEAVGAAAAALLPLIADVESTTVLVVVTVVYVLGLVPTFVVAGGSPIERRLACDHSGRTARASESWRPTVSLPVLPASLLMFAASAPTLLSVGLAAELHGDPRSPCVAVAFTVGLSCRPVGVPARPASSAPMGPACGCSVRWG